MGLEDWSDVTGTLVAQVVLGDVLHGKKIYRKPVKLQDNPKKQTAKIILIYVNYLIVHIFS